MDVGCRRGIELHLPSFVHLEGEYKDHCAQETRLGSQGIHTIMHEVLYNVHVKNYTSSRKTSFHAKFQAQCLHGLPILALHYNILSGLIIMKK